jgi:allophanate hydrolase subunit 2
VISTEDDTVITKEGRTLKSGDIIQIKTNAKDEMEDFTLLFNSDDIKTEFSKSYGNDNEMVIVYGKVVKKFSDSINVTVNGATAQNYSTTNATVLKLDTNKTTNKVSVTDAGEISKWEDGANEERVFIRIYKDEIKEIVIVK